MGSIIAIGPEQTHRVLLYRNVKAIDVLSRTQVIEKSLVSEFVPVIFVGPNLYLQDATIYRLILHFEQFDEVSLHQHVLAHLALGQEVPGDRDLVIATGISIIVNHPQSHQVVLASRVVLHLVDHEPSHVAVSVVLQRDAVIKSDLSPQNTSELLPQRLLLTHELVCLQRSLNKLLQVLAIVLHLNVLRPYLLVLVELPLSLLLLEL